MPLVEMPFDQTVGKVIRHPEINPMIILSFGALGITMHIPEEERRFHECTSNLSLFGSETLTHSSPH
jgi:hypothetical protein